MRKALLALTIVLAVAVAAMAFGLWPGRPAVESAAPAAQETGSACTACTLHHQRLSAPKD